MKFLKILKKIVLATLGFVVKEIFSFIIKGALLLIIILVAIGVVVKYSTIQEKPKIKKDSYVSIDFGAQYLEKPNSLSQFLLEDSINFYTLLNKLNSIEEDSNIKGVVLKLDALSLDRAQVEELREKFLELKKAGKEIIAFATEFNNRNYSLASISDKILMPPTMSAGVNLTGYYSELPYYKGLADRFGVTFNVINVGDYKSYGENFTKQEMSAEYRENMVRLQDKIYSNFVSQLVSDRGVNRELINERLLAGDFMSAEPYQMEKFKLVDGLIYEDELESALGKDKIIPIESYQQKIVVSKDKIAIIYAEGTILANGDKGGIDGSVTVDKISSELEKALKDKSVKGIVLRINSPGGSALASNIINHKIREVAKQKPVYVSIGGVAASGGYYIAVAGNKIFADKESLTGSIGVVSLIPNFNELMKKIDVNVESIKKGEYSDLYSLTKKFSEQDREKIYASSLKVYSEFLDSVAMGRGLDREYVHSIAQGKVWLGEEGKELGLVDEIGGIENTISALAQNLGIENYQVVEVIEGEKLDTIFKSYLPFKLFFKEILNFPYDKEMYFRPLYFFPYNV